MLNHTRTLKQSGLVGFALKNLSVGAFNHIREVLLQLHHLACTIYYVHAIVIVEEQRAVVEVAHARYNLPWALGLVGSKNIGIAHGTTLVGSQQGIELTLVVFERCGPLSASVNGTLGRREVVLGRVGQLVEDVTHGLPVLQVFRLHDGCARHQVHGGGYQIEGIAHADDVGVGYIGPQHGVVDHVCNYVLMLACSMVLCLHIR